MNETNKLTDSQDFHPTLVMCGHALGELLHKMWDEHYTLIGLIIVPKEGTEGVSPQNTTK